MIYAIDIDNTLCVETCWTAEDCLNATPMKAEIDKVNELYNKHFIVIYTARKHHLYEATIRWLEKHGVKYSAIRMEKMPCDFYFDLDAINDTDKL